MGYTKGKWEEEIEIEKLYVYIYFFDIIVIRHRK